MSAKPVKRSVISFFLVFNTRSNVPNDKSNETYYYS